MLELMKRLYIMLFIIRQNILVGKLYFFYELQ